MIRRTLSMLLRSGSVDDLKDMHRAGFLPRVLESFSRVFHTLLTGVFCFESAVWPLAASNPKTALPDVRAGLPQEEREAL